MRQMANHQDSSASFVHFSIESVPVSGTYSFAITGLVDTGCTGDTRLVLRLPIEH